MAFLFDAVEIAWKLQHLSTVKCCRAVITPHPHPQTKKLTTFRAKDLLQVRSDELVQNEMISIYFNQNRRKHDFFAFLLFSMHFHLLLENDIKRESVNWTEIKQNQGLININGRPRQARPKNGICIRWYRHGLVPSGSFWVKVGMFALCNILVSGWK